MIGMSKEKERNAQITCEIDEELDAKIQKIRKYKGKRIGWIVKEAIKRYLDGDIEI